jgi:hypothetical protein
VEKRYSFILSLTSALDGVGSQLHAPAALPQGKTRYLMYSRLGGPQGRSGRVRKILSLPGFDPQTFQTVASRYTDCALSAHLNACHSLTILVIVLSNSLVWESTEFNEPARFLFLLVGALEW